MWNKAPLLDNTPCAIQSLDNMSIDPVCDDGDDDDDDGDDDDDDDVDDQQEVELKVSFQMIPNGMQHLSLPNGHCHHFRRKSTTISSKNPPAPSSDGFKKTRQSRRKKNSSGIEFQSLIRVYNWKQGPTDPLWRRRCSFFKSSSASAPSERKSKCAGRRNWLCAKRNLRRVLCSAKERYNWLSLIMNAKIRLWVLGSTRSPPWKQLGTLYGMGGWA